MASPVETGRPTELTALVISPHADDAAAFCGATVAGLAREGWRVVIVRVTDDAKDSFGLTEAETMQRNAAEFEEAARVLGASEIVDLGYPTDSLADASETALRERFVYLLREQRPYAVFTFDPFGLYENNQDHVVCAQAMDEALWVSGFDLHHPEQFDEAVRPFIACERWYFGRRLPEINAIVDCTETLPVKIDALCAHRTMMGNQLEQLRLQAQAAGIRLPGIDQALNCGELRPVLDGFFTQQAQATAAAHGLPAGRAAEVFRLVRFGELEAFVRAHGERADAAPWVQRPELGD